MEILKLLKVEGATEPNAAMLNDEGEEYPIFLQSLHNTILFDEILKSGYKLAGLPYDFVKDGRSIMELPVEDYTPSPEEAQLMYDSIGKAHEMSYLLSKVDTSLVRGLATPATNYTIHTREEFLKYLDNVNSISMSEDFMPINYFVAPEARFTVSEYFSLEYVRYIRIMEKRRTMSYAKFQKLFNWLIQFNMSPNATFLDVVDAYFAWGFDGLNAVLISKNRQQRAVEISLESQPVERRITGLIDGNGNIYPPMHERSTVWHPDVASEEMLQQIYRPLAENEVTTVKLKSASSYNIILVNGVDIKAEIKTYTLKLNGNTQPTIKVMSIANNMKSIPAELALPQNKQRMLEHCQAEAIAMQNYEQRKDRTKVSSFQVLTWSGATPSEAIRYILRDLDMLATSSDKRFSTTGVQRVMPDDITYYLNGNRRNLVTDENGNEMSDPIDSVIYDVINGSSNTDMVEKGLATDSMVDASSLRDILITIHDTLGISYESIYNTLSGVTKDMKEVVLSNGTLNYKLNVSPINAAVRGYDIDMRAYDDKRANGCTLFYYVTLVALECAEAEGDTPKSDRAVGIEALTVDLSSSKDANMVINNLVDVMYNAIDYTQLPVSTKEQLEDSARRWAINSWFEIYARGTYTLPKLLGGVTTQASEFMRDTVLKCTQTRIDSTVGFCNTSIRAYQDEVRFSSYCVNAHVSVDRVIPRTENQTIHAIPFFAAWRNYRQKNPTLWGKLVEAGIIKEDFVAWECRYAQEQLWKDGINSMYAPSSLLVYCEDADEFLAEYPKDQEFKCVPHFSDIAYPGLYKDILSPGYESNDEEGVEDVEEAVMLDTPRTGIPVVRVGLQQTLTAASFAHYLKPVIQQEVKDIYLQKFSGFNAETLLKCPDVMSKLPNESGKTPILVMANTDKVVLGDTKEVIDFTRITTLDPNKYPITHVFDRTWLIASMGGILWEARI